MQSECVVGEADLLQMPPDFSDVMCAAASTKIDKGSETPHQDQTDRVQAIQYPAPSPLHPTTPHHSTPQRLIIAPLLKDLWKTYRKSRTDYLATNYIHRDGQTARTNYQDSLRSIAFKLDPLYRHSPLACPGTRRLCTITTLTNSIVHLVPIGPASRTVTHTGQCRRV